MTRLMSEWVDGLWPYQNHQFEVEKLELDERHVMYGVRVQRRQNADGQLGHYIIDDESAGDYIGGFLWIPENEGTRPISAWSSAWPVLTHTRDKRNRVNRTRDSFVPHAIPPPALGVVSSFPILDEFYTKDERFAREEPGFNPCWPKIPGNMVGIILDATREIRQIPLYHHTDPRMIAANAAGEGAYGSIVCDINKFNELDKERCARLQTAWRVVRPVGSCLPFSEDFNALAWQLGRTGLEPTEGMGLCYDNEVGSVGLAEKIPAQTGTFSLPKQDKDVGGTVAVPVGIVGAFGVQASGPFVSGAFGCQHKLTDTKDGEPVFSGHLGVNSYFIGLGGDGPLEFQPSVFPFDLI